MDLTLRDLQTGDVRCGAETVIAILRAPDEVGALSGEYEMGRRQREGIVAWLSHVIRRQIALPGAVTAAR